MPINIRTPGFHHVTLRSGNLERSKRFYSETLGFPIVMELPILIIFRVGTSVLVVRGNEPGTPPDDKFNPLRVGLDHLAMGCTDEAELERVAAALSAEGIENTGVKLDQTLGKKYVAFKDPDRIAWEFYMV